LDRFLAAVENPLKRHFESDFDVLAASARRAAAEKAVERPRGSEFKAEAAEYVAEIDAAKQVLGRKARDARAAARIIFGSFLGIAQNRVGFGDLLEALGRVRRLVAVGVDISGQVGETRP